MSECGLLEFPCDVSGAALLAHPGEDASGDIIVVSAPRCTLLRATEELGLCRCYHTGDMEAFSYNDRDNFRDSGTEEEKEALSGNTRGRCIRERGGDICREPQPSRTHTTPPEA